MNSTDVFTTIILVQLFFSMGMTGLTYALPTDTLDYLAPYTSYAEKTDFEDVNNQVQSNLDRQTNIPVIELGALVFYSGNILLDFILNFAFALPEMLTLFIAGILGLINVPAQIGVLIKLFVGVVVSVLYFISIIKMVVGIRSGRFT